MRLVIRILLALSVFTFIVCIDAVNQQSTEISQGENTKLKER